MDWASIGTEVILGIIGVAITALGTIITFVINKYVKDANLKNILSTLNTVVQSVVQEIYQTYVEGLKCNNMFDGECQKKALEMALEKVKTSLPADISAWLKANYTDIDAYLKTLIESAIYTLKK